jgi:anti-anti-sigma factor
MKARSFPIVLADMEPKRADLQIRTTAAGDACTLAFVGEIDLSNSTRAAHHLELVFAREPPPSALLLDLSGLTFIDSVGLAVLLSARRDAAAVGCRLSVESMSPAIARLFETTGVADLLISEG